MNRNEEFEVLFNTASEMPDALSGSVVRSRARYRRRRVPLRAAAIAACLCVAVMGTALATEIVIPRITEAVSGQEHSAYYVGSGLERKAMNDLGDGLNGDLAAGTLRRVWDDRAALEDYLGTSLLSGPELQGAGMIENLEEDISYGWNNDSTLVEFPDARYVLTGLTLDGQPAGNAPEQLKIAAHRVVKNAEVTIRAQIITEHADPAQLEKGLLGMEYLPVHSLLNYVVYDDQGNRTWVTEHITTAEQKFTIDSYEMACGIPAIIVTAEDTVMDSHPNADKAVNPLRGFRSYVGHFIYDGVLYTVFPDAVYDPDLSYPSEDSDMLDVLKYVLNCFELPQ